MDILSRAIAQVGCLIQRKDCAIFALSGRKQPVFHLFFAIDRRRMLPTSTEAPAQSGRARAVPPAMAGTVQRQIAAALQRQTARPLWWAGLFGALSRVLGVGEPVARRAWVVGGRPRDDKGSGK